MPRRPREAIGGIPFHVLNRAVGRGRLFMKQADFLAFETIIEQIQARIPMRVLSYCHMPNHWHLVLWPREDGDLSEFMRLLTVTHTQRWHAHHDSAGTGPVYQGRFKSFPIQADEHLLSVCRYVERNPLRANLVERAEQWRWSSLWQRINSAETPWLLPQAKWPAEPPEKWLQWVNRPQTAAEEAAIAEANRRGRPYGSDVWQKRMAGRLNLQSTLRPQGRPRIHPIKDSRPR